MSLSPSELADLCTGLRVGLRSELALGRAASTRARYRRHVQDFVRFCSVLGLTQFPSDATVIIDYLLWLKRVGCAGSADSFVHALRAEYTDSGVPFPTDPRVSKLASALVRGWRCSSTPLVREPFPVWAVRWWCRRGRQVCRSDFIWRRNAAMCLLGLRCMLRPGEIAELEVRDVVFSTRQEGVLSGGSFDLVEGSALLKLTVRKSKVDQECRGRSVWVEPLSGSDALDCPVAFLSSYLTSLGNVDPHSPLFPSSRSPSKALSASAVSDVVKRVASAAGVSARVSGHSLRIGGACAAAQAGLGIESIRAIGGWVGDAVFLYVRGCSVPRLQATDKMWSL